MLTEIRYSSKWIAIRHFTIGIGSNTRNPNSIDLPIPKGTILKWDGDSDNGNVWFIVTISETEEYRGKIESGIITNVINDGKIELVENGNGPISLSGEYLQKLLKK